MGRLYRPVYPRLYRPLSLKNKGTGSDPVPPKRP